jgi:hypothetical protein
MHGATVKKRLYKQNARGRRFNVSPIAVDIEDKTAGKQIFGVASICRYHFCDMFT